MSGTKRKIAATILAAGSSSRMGRNKLFLDWQGETLLQRAVRTAAVAGLDPVIVVAGFDSDRVFEHLTEHPCRVIRNPRHDTGMHSSAAAAAEALAGEAEAFIVVLPDMPLVSAEMLARIRAEHLERGVCLVASRYGDVVAPPTLFAASLFPELRSLAGGNVRDVVERLWEEAAVVDWPESVLRDVDTPADFEALRRHDA